MQNQNEGEAAGTEFLICDAKNCFIEVLKEAEDQNGTIVRIYENRNRHTRTKISLPKYVKQIYECNLMEKNERELEIQEHVVEVVLKPYEIKTYRIL